MNKLLIQREGRYFVKNKNNAAVECQRLTDALDIIHTYPAALAHVYRDEAVRLISTIFRVLHAVQIGVGGEGAWWFAEAEIQRNDRTYFLSVEECSDPISALRALIVEIVKDDNRRLD